MTATSRIRFLEPVDPRTVWDAVEAAVGAPGNLRRVHHCAYDETINAPNPSIRAVPDQGADVLAWMYYGAEGSILTEDSDESTDPPVAYVEVCIDSPSGSPSRGRVFNDVAGWSPVSTAVFDDQSDTRWHLTGS